MREQYGINRAYLFGSLTRPYRFTERSDVDVAVESIDSESFFQAMARLSEQVEREVDLVELSKCPFADRIRQQGIVWSQNI
jgi:predicted nucleotidyltransferase